jgi:hypothetical protein
MKRIPAAKLLDIKKILTEDVSIWHLIVISLAIKNKSRNDGYNL